MMPEGRSSRLRVDYARQESLSLRNKEVGETMMPEAKSSWLCLGRACQDCLSLRDKEVGEPMMPEGRGKQPFMPAR
eukprot:487794-Pelagomonas_calceolata.AAC.3